MMMLEKEYTANKKGLLSTATFLMETKYAKLPSNRKLVKKHNLHKKDINKKNSNTDVKKITVKNRKFLFESPTFFKFLCSFAAFLFIVLLSLVVANKIIASGIVVYNGEGEKFLKDIVSNYLSYGQFFDIPEPAYQEVDPSQFSALNVREYTIKKGDTLYDIAKQFNLRLDTIISFNTMADVRRIPLNTKIYIPDRDGLLYTVKKGDTLEAIAKKYDVSIVSILDTNDLSTDKLTVGQKLFLPGVKMSSFELKKALGELFIYPVKGRFTSYFGMRKDPFTNNGPLRFHNGLDIANAIGTPVKAALAGRVVKTGTHSIYGKYVIISHYGGFQTLYGHMSRIVVKAGQYVSQGQKIGEVGSTGYSSGPHLHFSVFKNGKAVDPLKYLR